jgi:hypothetical protein
VAVDKGGQHFAEVCQRLSEHAALVATVEVASRAPYLNGQAAGRQAGVVSGTAGNERKHAFHSCTLRLRCVSIDRPLQVLHTTSVPRT